MALGSIGIIVAARTNSSRLPGKALKPLQGMPMILFLLERLKPLRGASVVVATTELENDDHLAETVAGAGVPVFRGSANDLVARYAAAAAQFGFDTVGRVTGDCPFVNAEMVEHCLVQAAANGPFDLATTKGEFPVGLDIELFPANRMAALNANPSLSEAHREHLTLYIYDNPGDFMLHKLQPRPDWRIAGHSFTVDTASDYQAAMGLANCFDRPNFPLHSLIERAAA
jgi:spore coat polysaccharide biosynthesis protein SpsF